MTPVTNIGHYWTAGLRQEEQGIFQNCLWSANVSSLGANSPLSWLVIDD
jgi:hypothetical protein